jgi:hypothetical protein
MSINPRDEHAALAEARELAQALARLGNRTADEAFAGVAWTCATQVLEREDAVVAVIPDDSDGIAPYFLEGFDDGSF